MESTPIIQDLVQDNTPIIYDKMNGPTRYRMSMISKNWNKYCTNRITKIACHQQLEHAVNNVDIVSIILNFTSIKKDNLMFLVFAGGNIELINILIRKIKNMFTYIGRGEHNISNWNSGFKGACYGGHTKIIMDMIKYGKIDIDAGILGACAGGRIDIIRLLASYCRYTPANAGFALACINGHSDMVQLMMKKGAADMDVGVSHACIHGHLNAIKLIFEEYPTYTLANLQYACQGGNIDIINFMLKNGADNWNYGLKGACRGGHMDIVKLMIKKGASYWDKGLRNACRNGHLDIVILMIEQGADDWNGGLYNACKNGHSDIAMLMLENGADDLNDGLTVACKKYDLLLPTNWNFGLQSEWCLYDIDKTESTTHVNSNLIIIQILIEYGATLCEHCNRTMQQHLDML